MNIYNTKNKFKNTSKDSVQKNVLLLSPYPDNIKNVILAHGDKVQVYNNKINADFIKNNSFDFIVSFGYSYIIDLDSIDAVRGAAVNLHIGYLPLNRGAHPNVWSNIEGTISGVTIHLIDEGLDTGNILFQKEVSIDQSKHTFSSSYNLMISEIEKLFLLNWHYIRLNECQGWRQQGKSSYHSVADLEKIKKFFHEGWDTNISLFKSEYLKEKIK